MSVERRVKPSNKMKAALKKKRVPLKRAMAIVLVLCLLLGVVAVAIPFLVDKFGKPKNQYNGDDAATRNMLAARTSYEGEWATGPDNLFQVYLPGELVNEEGYNSTAFTYVRQTDYDNSCTRAYGVVVGEEKFDIGLQDDPMTILDTVTKQMTADIGKVCYAGYPSGAYDVEFVSLNDGRQAIKLSGDVTMTVIYQENKDSTETYQDTLTYPILGFVTLERGYPVLVWGCWDPFDYFANEESPTYIEEMANTLWQTKYTGDKENWVTVETQVDEDGHIIFPNSEQENNIINDDPVQEDSNTEPVAEEEPHEEVHDHVHTDGEVAPIPEGVDNQN